MLENAVFRSGLLFFGRAGRDSRARVQKTPDFCGFQRFAYWHDLGFRGRASRATSPTFPRFWHDRHDLTTCQSCHGRAQKMAYFCGFQRAGTTVTTVTTTFYSVGGA